MVTWRNVNVSATLLIQSPRLQMFGWVPVVSMQVLSVKVYIVRRTWLKERKIFTQNTFLVHAQTILKVNDVFVQFHFLSSYRKHSHRNDFVSQRPVSVRFSSVSGIAQPRWYPECTDWPETVIAKNWSWPVACVHTSPLPQKNREKRRESPLPIFPVGEGTLASHAYVLRGSSRVPVPLSGRIPFLNCLCHRQYNILYSRLSLNGHLKAGHLCKTDTYRVGQSLSFLP